MKTQNPFMADKQFLNFLVPSVSDLVGVDKEEMLLCLTKTFLGYLRRMRRLAQHKGTFLS